MSSGAGQQHDFGEAKRSLRQEALASDETAVRQHHERQPPAHDEGLLILYQVMVRPMAQLPEGSPNVDYYDKRGSKAAIIVVLKEAMNSIGVDWDIVQEFEWNDGFCFPLRAQQVAPFQTRAWQSLVEVRRLNLEEDSWDIVTPFPESRLAKECKARAMRRLANTEPDMVEAEMPANLPGDDSYNKVASNDEHSTAKSTTCGVASLLDGTCDMNLEDID